MSNKGDAYAIATAIYAGTKNEPIVDIDVLTDRLYTTLSGGFLGSASDEYKADLYAQLAERLHADTPFEKAVDIIESALQKTAVRYG